MEAIVGTPTVDPTPAAIPAQPQQQNTRPDDSLYLLLFAITAVFIFLSLGVAGAITFLQPVQPTVLGEFGRLNEVSRSISPSPSPATKETWVLKGYAVGKKASNDTGNPMMAEVVRLTDNTYRMYYGWAGPNQTTAIKSATSKDGKTWTVESGYRLQGASDNSDREHVVSGPSLVHLADGRWRMYYQSSPQIQQGKAPSFHVRSAISTDGLTFTREGVRIEISPYSTTTGLSLAGHGTYFMAGDGTYVGIFSGNLASNQQPSDLVMATSKDGLTWGTFKKLYTQWHDPVVLKTKNGYIIYATYLTEKQGMAVSTDGLTWPNQMTDITMQDQSGKTLTEGNSGVGDIGGVVNADGTIRLYVNYGNPSDSIGYLEK